MVCGSPGVCKRCVWRVGGDLWARSGFAAGSQELLTRGEKSSSDKILMQTAAASDAYIAIGLLSTSGANAKATNGSVGRLRRERLRADLR